MKIIDRVEGNKAVLKGLDGSVTLNDFTEDMFIFAFENDQFLFGTAGKDLLRGGDGDDTLNGLENVDKYFGGAGEDTFILGADKRDKVADFEDDVDLLDVSGWGVTAFGELNIEDRDKWIRISDGNGHEALVRAEDGSLDVGDLDAGDFLFLPP